MTVEHKKENIKKVLETLSIHKTAILVGENASGKSVVRKMLGHKIQEITGDPGAKARAISMQRRVSSSGDGIGAFFNDASWEPTSICSFDLVRGLLESTKDSPNSYLILDEPEIGMSKESQLGLALYLRNNIDRINETTYGMLIITHSEYIVENLKDKVEFMNLSNLDQTVDEWINRDIIPTDFEQLDKDSNELFQALLPKKENSI